MTSSVDRAPLKSQVTTIDKMANTSTDDGRKPDARRSRRGPRHQSSHTDVFIERSDAEYFTFTTSSDGQMGDVRLHGSWLEHSVGHLERVDWLGMIHPDDWKIVAAAWERAVATRTTCVTDCRIRRYDGVERHYAIHVMPQFDTRGRLHQWMGFGLDVTTQQEREWSRIQGLVRKYVAREHHDWTTLLASERAAVRELERTRERLEAVQSISDVALSTLAEEDLLREVLRRVEDAMEVDNVCILLLDADGSTLRVHAVRGMEEATAKQVRVPVGQGFAGYIAATGAPLIVDDVSAFPVANNLLREYLYAIVGVPLLTQDRLIGVLHVGSATPRRFTNQDVDFLTRVADRLALAMDRAQLYDLARAAQQKASERATQLETIFDAIPDAVLIYDPSGNIVRLNQPARELYRVDQFPDNLTLGLSERSQRFGLYHETGLPLPPEDWPLTRVLRGEVVGGTYRRPVEYILDAHDGQRLHLSASGAPLRDEAGHITGAVLVIRDISEHWRLAHEREEALVRELAAQEITRNLDEFFKTAAHDIRNPATVAKSRAQLALREFSKVEAAVVSQHPELAGTFAAALDNLAASEQSASTLVRLVARLFDVARARAGQLEVRPEHLDLAAFVREQVAAQQISAPNREIALEVVGDGPVNVMGDADRLGQVLANYVTNALKYSPKDQPIVVRLEVTEGLAVVSVTDQGPGLPLLEQHLVWEIFHRAPGVEVRGESRGSLGLGLHICKRIVEMHPGGKVGVESAVGQGSTFWFRLPVASPDPDQQP